MFLYENLIKGIFLLIISVCGNFVAETLGCKAQKLLSSNMICKQIVIFSMIYFAIGFTSPPHKLINPMNILKVSFYIWFLFLMFNRMHIFFMILVFILLSLKYFIMTYVTYFNLIIKEINQNDSTKSNLKSDKQNYKSIEYYQKRINILEKIQQYIIYSIIITILIGFILYTRLKLNEYKSKWSIIKYIFGVNKCKSLG